MTPEEIKAKSAELAAFYTAKANGKMLQYRYQHNPAEWSDPAVDSGPTMESDLSRWRVKPEPRRMWTFNSRSGATGRTDDERLVATWRDAEYTVNEWQEVLP